jgi:hypothetical protein
LTIAPAPIGVDLRITTDPSSQRNAIVAATLTGPLIDLINQQGTIATTPAGSWKLSVIDSEGNVAFEKEVAQPAGGAPYFSTYWQAVPADTTFTGTAVFTPDAASAGNFTLSAPPSVAYTSPAADPGNTNPTVPPEPVEPGDPAPTSLPVWLLVLGGLIGAGLITAIIIFAVKLSRLGAAADTPEPDLMDPELTGREVAAPETTGPETIDPDATPPDEGWSLGSEDDK